MRVYVCARMHVSCTRVMHMLMDSCTLCMCMSTGVHVYIWGGLLTECMYALMDAYTLYSYERMRRHDAHASITAEYHDKCTRADACEYHGDVFMLHCRYIWVVIDRSARRRSVHAVQHKKNLPQPAHMRACGASRSMRHVVTGGGAL